MLRCCATNLLRANWHSLMLGAWAIVVSLSGQAAILLPNTRAVFDGSRSDLLIRLGNEGPAERVTVWVDEGDQNTPPETSQAPFAVSPPVVRVDRDAQRPVRIVRLAQAKLPEDRESMFWLNVRGVPEGAARPASDQGQMAVTVRARIKLFYRPPGLAGGPGQAPEALRWQWQQGASGGEPTLVIHNPTPWYVSLNALEGQGQNLIARLPAGTIAPLCDTRVPLHGVILLTGQALRLQVRWIDDSGSTHPLEVFASAAD